MKQRFLLINKSHRLGMLVLLVVGLGHLTSAQTAVTMNKLYRLNVNGTDRMTSTDPATEGCTSETCPSEGPMFYVPSGAVTGTLTLYRHNNGPDHRDSPKTEIPGYVNEGPNGFPWKGQVLPGLSPLLDGFNQTTGDHALVSPMESLPDYTRRSLGVYGYPRFGNTTESMLALTAGGVRIESNRVNGGALRRWTWNGKQFLSDVDASSGSYSILFLNNYADFLNENVDDCQNHAPITLAVNEGSTQSTTAVPLANSFAHPGGDPCLNPVVWIDALVGKRVRLNFRGLGPVAKYTTSLWLPGPLSAVDFYHPITLVNPEFNRYWTYDAETDDLQEVTLADACEDSHPFFPGFGGIILSDQSAQYAMGIYAVNVSQGGSITALNLLRHSCNDGTYSRMDVIRSADLPAGSSTYNAYVMSSDVQQVRQYMRKLFAGGVR